MIRKTASDAMPRGMKGVATREPTDTADGWRAPAIAAIGTPTVRIVT